MIGRKLVIAVGSAAVAGTLSATLAFAAGPGASLSGKVGDQPYNVNVDGNSWTAGVSYGGRGLGVNLLDVPNKDGTLAAIDWATNNGVPSAEKTVNDNVPGAVKTINDQVGDAETTISKKLDDTEKTVNKSLVRSETKVNVTMSAAEKELNSVQVSQPTVHTDPTLSVGPSGVQVSPGVSVSGGSVSLGIPSLP